MLSSELHRKNMEVFEHPSEIGNIVVACNEIRELMITNGYVGLTDLLR